VRAAATSVHHACRRADRGRGVGLLPAADAGRPGRLPAHGQRPAGPGPRVRGGGQGAGHARVAGTRRPGGRPLCRHGRLQGRPGREKRVTRRRHRLVQHARQVSFFFFNIFY